MITVCEVYLKEKMEVILMEGEFLKESVEDLLDYMEEDEAEIIYDTYVTNVEGFNDTELKEFYDLGCFDYEAEQIKCERLIVRRNIVH